MPMMSTTWRPRMAALLPGLFVALSMVMFLVTEIFGSLGFRDTTPIPQRVWLRYCFHLLLMLAVLGGPTRLSFVRTSRPALQIFRSLMMLAMPMCYLWATMTARSTTVFGVFSLSPLLVIGLASLGRDAVPRVAAALTAIGCLGAWILYRPDVASMGWGIVPALGMGLSYSAYLVLTPVLDRTEDLLTNLFYSALGVFVVLTLTAPLYWAPVGLRELVTGAALATSGWIGLYLVELGLRRDTAARLAPFMLTQTLLDGVFRVIDRGRHPDVAIVLGSIIVLAAIAAAFVQVASEPRHAAAVRSPAAADGAA